MSDLPANSGLGGRTVQSTTATSLNLVRALSELFLIRKGYPVSKVCPQCGGVEFAKRRPDKFFSRNFTWDRVCKSCDTRYTPPTPRPIAIMIAALGFALVAQAIWGAAIGIVGVTEGDRSMMIYGAWSVGFGIFGAVVVWFGVREFKRYSKV